LGISSKIFADFRKLKRGKGMTKLKNYPEAYQCLLARRSVRDFTEEPISEEMVEAILMAGRQAPSGKNNQPWRFVVIQDKEVKMLLAGETVYGRIIAHAPLVIPVFLDHQAVYHPLKDHLAMGACLENMLLAAQALGLGGVWLGEILKNKEAVRNHLGLDSSYELMAVLVFGHSRKMEKEIPMGRKPLEDLILKKFI
jgi:nitroreductase